MVQIGWSVVRLIFWMLAVPFFIGQLFNFILPSDKKHRTFGITYLLGLLIYFAVFEVISIPCMVLIKYSAFKYCIWIYGVISVVLALLGACKYFGFLFTGKDDSADRDIKTSLDYVSDLKSMKIDTKIYFGIFIALVLLQMVMTLVYAPFDGDDAYYVVQSLQAQQLDVMNTVNPYLGRSNLLSHEYRHALAVITMWIAFIAKASGVHATIVAHSVMPLFVIPLVYFVYYQIAKVLFKDMNGESGKKELVPVFMIFITLLMMFGNVSINTPATFLLMRTWQGKTLFCSLVLPMILWIFLLMFEDVEKVREVQGGLKETAKVTAPWWIMLTLVNMFAGMCTSLGAGLGPVFIALLTLILLIVSKRKTVVLGAAVSVIPSIVYVGIYKLLAHGLLHTIFNR
ncbi:hypothetical protein D6856_09820 [Butyrivibrio sp. XB500-5]|uniref:DUF6077 domain-containing protein n=1 Tax=Butyrivibrio sp. XB500-5 TaxID=2364880 RepID=UPI000EA83AAA|nr:DUF6077 domain-containing protein [Butyrivibrio sp. XB500-5]RKM59507.1 hypothetical protein D6856_09820 [Butyrivibrio sp. XB500-5]